MQSDTPFHFQLICDLPLPRLQPRPIQLSDINPPLKKDLDTIMGSLLWSSHSATSCPIPLWSVNEVSFRLQPYKLDRPSLESHECLDVHPLLRSCALYSSSNAEQLRFRDNDGHFLIVPLGELVSNGFPTSWIVVFGEDKGIWLLRDDVDAYLLGAVDANHDDWYEGAAEDWYPEDEGDELLRAAQVDVLADYQAARIGDFEELVKRPNEFPRFSSSLQLFHCRWSIAASNTRKFQSD